jgi:hypothetical protein
LVEVIRDFDPFVVEPGDRGYIEEATTENSKAMVPRPLLLLSSRIPNGVVPLYNPIDPTEWLNNGTLRILSGDQTTMLDAYHKHRHQEFLDACRRLSLNMKIDTRTRSGRTRFDAVILRIIKEVPGILEEQITVWFAGVRDLPLRPYWYSRIPTRDRDREARYHKIKRSVQRHLEAGRVRALSNFDRDICARLWVV